MPLEIIRELWLCDDCTILEVNGDASGMSAEREAACQAGFARIGQRLSANWDSETGDGIEEFSWRGCDCCSPRLGGSLHRFAILGEVTT